MAINSKHQNCFTKFFGSFGKIFCRFETKLSQDVVEIEKMYSTGFCCHICGQPGEAPPIESYFSFPFYSLTSIPTHYSFQLLKPINLQRCPTCGKWTCIRHMKNEHECVECKKTLH